MGDPLREHLRRLPWLLQVKRSGSQVASEDYVASPPPVSHLEPDVCASSLCASSLDPPGRLHRASQLRREFEQYGPIRTLRMVNDLDGKPRG